VYARRRQRQEAMHLIHTDVPSSLPPETAGAISSADGRRPEHSSDICTWRQQRISARTYRGVVSSVRQIRAYRSRSAA
jgi:hypothetical protein